MNELQWRFHSISSRWRIERFRLCILYLHGGKEVDFYWRSCCWHLFLFHAVNVCKRATLNWIPLVFPSFFDAAEIARVKQKNWIIRSYDFRVRGLHLSILIHRVLDWLQKCRQYQKENLCTIISMCWCVSLPTETRLIDLYGWIYREVVM